MSFNAWEAKNLIGGQKFLVVMTIFNPILLVFESQTPSCKPNPVSCGKISQTFVSNTEKVARVIGEEIR